MPDHHRHYGVYPAIVTDLVDPDRLGRVEVRLPWLGDTVGNPVRSWARLVSPYADDDQGLEIIPEVGSEVIVGFEAGDHRRPYVLGASWNGRERLPVNPDASNDIRVLRTRSGSILEFDDSHGAAKITLELQSGHSLVLDDSARTITVHHAGGSSITLDDVGVHIVATATVDVTAAMVTVNAPMSRFTGVVQCETLISNAVVSASYTPGAGNIW